MKVEVFTAIQSIHVVVTIVQSQVLLIAIRKAQKFTMSHRGIGLLRVERYSHLSSMLWMFRLRQEHVFDKMVEGWNRSGTVNSSILLNNTKVNTLSLETLSQLINWRKNIHSFEITLTLLSSEKIIVQNIVILLVGGCCLSIKIRTYWKLSRPYTIITNWFKTYSLRIIVL